MYTGEGKGGPDSCEGRNSCLTTLLPSYLMIRFRTHQLSTTTNYVKPPLTCIIQYH
jgi:hypothetical protein